MPILLRGEPIHSTPHIPLSSHRGTESIVVPFLFFSGLLLAALIADVFWLMPHKTPEQRQNLIPVHQSLKNVIIAEQMITKLLPLPPTRWLYPVRCGEIGRGVWYAEGRVGVDSFVGEVTVSWKAIFVPAPPQPLYLAVGSREEGDFTAALRLAGIHPKTP